MVIIHPARMSPWVNGIALTIIEHLARARFRDAACVFGVPPLGDIGSHLDTLLTTIAGPPGVRTRRLSP
jgi:hypothetical protein